jgi:hypothetical protein
MADSTFEPEVRRSLDWLRKVVGGEVPPIAIECKKTQESRLSFDKVKEHQIEGLLEFEEQGLTRKLVVSQGFGTTRRFTTDTPFDFVFTGAGRGYVLVNFRFTKKAPRKDIPKGTNRCFGVRVGEYVKAMEDAVAEGKASLSYDWFEENGIECERLRVKNDKGVAESGWDLEPLTK